MSASLVKQSLSLFEDDLAKSTLYGQKKKSADPLKLIGTRKKGVKKELERLKKQQQKNKQVKFKKSDSSRGNAPSWCPEEIDYTEESVKALQKLERTKVMDKGTASMILDHHQKNVVRVREKPKHKPTRTDNKTAFTDSDFDKFLKEFDFK